MKKKEPWRIDRDSVHFKVLKGWLPERFKSWLSITAEQYKLSEDELLIRIIETIRKITWKTFQILKEKTGKEVNLPLIIISENPVGDLALFTAIVKRNNNPDFFCDKKSVIVNLNFLNSILYHLEGLVQSCRALADKPNILGCTNNFGIAIYDRSVKVPFKKFDTYSKALFLRIVTEESLHFFCNQTDEFRNKELTQELMEKTKGLGIYERDKLIHKIEKKYGVKRIRDNLIKVLEQEEKDLFSLLPCVKQ